MTDAWADAAAAASGAAARFRDGLARGAEIQRRELAAILAANRTCEYGERYGFRDIRDADDYRARVPIVDYEDLRAGIDRTAATGACPLAADPVVAFELTGGSAGGRKLVPYTQRALERFERALVPWIDDLVAAYPGITRGRAYWAISPVGRAPAALPSGIPLGLDSDASYLGPRLGPPLARTLAVPWAVSRLADLDAWRFATLVWLLAARDLAFFSVWSPSFLAELLAPLDDPAAAGELCAAVAAGCFGPWSDVAAAAGVSAPPADPARAREVEAALRRSSWTLRDLWPGAALISCWTDGSSRLFLERLARRSGALPIQGKGLIATEAVASVPLSGYGHPVLAIESAFFEFLDTAGTARLAHEVVAGEHYSLVLTTWGGLYRYRIGDRVRVHGFAGEAPLLEFLGREGAATDLVGEKLTESFVLSALGARVGGDWMLLPTTAPRSGYVLLCGRAPDPGCRAGDADAALCANPQYAYARALGQLAPLRIEPRPRLVAELARLRHARCGRIGDLKPPALGSLELARELGVAP